MTAGAMAGAIAVPDAGSSSIELSLFTPAGVDLALAVRGQAEGLHSAPRFVAKAVGGETVSSHTWSDGNQLGHDGAMEHIVVFRRDRLAGWGLAGIGHRVVHGRPKHAQPAWVIPTNEELMTARHTRRVLG